MFFGFLSGFLWICECLGTPFSLLTSVPLVLKPILTFSKGRNKLLYFVKDFFSQSLQSITLAPSRSPPKGRCRLLLFVGKPFNIRQPRVSVPPLRGRLGGG